MRRVLLVDDSASNRLVLGTLLEDEGLRVDEADSVAQARGMLCAEGAAYDVVLLDQQLGDGLGASLVSVVRARIPSARVMLISGSADCDIPPGLYDAEVPKGRDFNDVMGLMRELLAAPTVPGDRGTR
jgi:two-component system, response regulator RegA